VDFAVPEGFATLQREMERFVEDELRPLDRSLDPAEDYIPLDVRRCVQLRSAELGFYAADYPAAEGGRDLPQLDMVLLREAAARTGCRLAPLATWGSDGPSPILLHGTPRQREEYLAPLCAGRMRKCLGLTEPDAGSDAQAITTSAVLSGSRWVLNGTKSFMSNVPEAEIAIVLAVTGSAGSPARGRRGTTAFIVPCDTPGFRVRRERRGMLEEERYYEVSLEDCEVPPEQVIGGPDAVGTAMLTALESFALARLSLAAMCNGIAAHALDLGLAHARRRHAFGQRIGQHQYVQGHLVDSHVELEASRLLTYRCAWRYDAGDPVPRESAVAKLYATEMASRVVDRMIQVHGGQGWMRELPLERAYRLTRMLRIVDGTSEIQRVIIASTLSL